MEANMTEKIKITRDDKSAKYKLQMEELYKKQYGTELKFDTVEKRGKFLVASVKKKEMSCQYFEEDLRECSFATYFVVQMKQGKLRKDGLVMNIEADPEKHKYYYDRDGRNDRGTYASMSLKINSGQMLLAEISSQSEKKLEATDNAQVSAWLKKEYADISRYEVHNDASWNKNLDDNAKRIAKNDALKFAQGFIKKFICNGDEWTAEKSRLKRVEKIGILRKKVNDKWEKQAADEKKSAQEQKHQQATREVSGQQRIMQRYVQKSLMERITDWFK